MNRSSNLSPVELRSLSKDAQTILYELQQAQDSKFAKKLFISANTYEKAQKTLTKKPLYEDNTVKMNNDQVG